jgi:hypothetical protein
MHLPESSFSRRLIWYVLVGIALYWLGNVVAVFPWLISRTLGIVAMFLSTILWGYVTFYCLKHVPRNVWNQDTLVMALIFLITAVIEDYFLYAVYRGIPDELYVPSTFLAYGMVFLLPFFVRYVLLRKYTLKSVLRISHAKLLITALIGIVSCIITLWSVEFW